MDKVNQKKCATNFISQLPTIAELPDY